MHSRSKSAFPHVIILRVNLNLSLQPPPDSAPECNTPTHTHTHIHIHCLTTGPHPLSCYLLVCVFPALRAGLGSLCWAPGRHCLSFMTPVMAVIVAVEITCQEDSCGGLREGVPLLTRGDRGRAEGTRGRAVERLKRSWSGGGPGWEALMTCVLIISRRGLWDNSAVNAT